MQDTMKTLELFRDTVSKWMTGYADAYAEVAQTQNFKHPFRNVVSSEMPDIIRCVADITSPYTVVGSYGKGRWTAVPWVSIFDTRITSSAQHGVYIVYLLNKDARELFLTFEIAATEVLQNPSGENSGPLAFTGLAGRIAGKAANTLKERADAIRMAIQADGFQCDDAIKTGSQGYDSGAVYYKKYSISNLPSGEQLADDLRKMMQIYRRYYEWINRQSEQETWWPALSEYDPGITKEQWLALLNNPDIIGPVWGGFLAAFYQKKNGVSCKEIGELYHRSPSSIIGNCINLGKKIHQMTNCPLGERDNGQNRYWTIMFFGRDATEDETGGYIWKLRPELYDALTEFKIMRYEWNRGEPEMTLTPKEIIAKINAYIASKGFTYEGKLIENFYLSLKSKPFVILAGTSGTGKTRLVKLFAEAIGAAYKLVPVRPDWSDSTDLFGHVDLNGRFVPGAVIDFIKAAQDDPGRPYFLCLDEMNLARVEYYLSDFLSVIETRDMENGKIVSDPLVAATQYGPDKDAIGKYGTIIFPQNLYVVGTVNMDETTFPFSKKVLDRANTIEFSYVDLIPKAGTGDVCEVQPAPNSFLRSDYLLLSQCIGEDDYIGGICAELQKINIILQSANAHVGYRVRDEIVFYMLNNKNAESLMTDDEALDHEILQKILPRIQGSSASVKDMLCKLFDVFAADHNQRSGDSDSEKMQKVLADAGVNCKYRKSAEKLLMMVRRFEEDGFTSYWL